MNYEEKLREIINSNSEYYPSEDKAVFAKYFPELEENEDERIRKGLIRAVSRIFEGHKLFDTDVTREEALAWLEKQGEEEYALKSSRDEDVREFMQYIEKQAKAYEFNLPNRGYDIYAFAKDILYWLEKQGEKKAIFNADDWYVSKVDGKIHNAKFIEKQGEQKSADNVEPKFHEGDWVLNNVCYPMQIASIKDSMYIFTEGDAMSVSFVDEHLHLWSIQDAEDGDVLVNWNNTTFIFKAIEDETVKFHIAYNEKWDTIKTPSTKLSHLGLSEPQFEFHLATKEQRDLLFSKMKETGYEWDSEKKELKKIEPK